MESAFHLETLMLKLLTRVMPGMFRKQTRKNMMAFREFAEAR